MITDPMLPVMVFVTSKRLIFSTTSCTFKMESEQISVARRLVRKSGDSFSFCEVEHVTKRGLCDIKMASNFASFNSEVLLFHSDFESKVFFKRLKRVLNVKA